MWVVVRDRGIGIPAAEQARLFTRFFRASNTAGQNGLGIGLYLVHDIVTRHGGSIALHSTAGQGTAVTVRLPLRARRTAGARGADGHECGAGIRIKDAMEQ